MARQVIAVRHLLLFQLHARVPERRIDQGRPRMLGRIGAAEQAYLLRVALRLLGRRDRDADGRQQARAMIVDGVESAAADERLYHAAIDDALVDALAQVE